MNRIILLGLVSPVLLAAQSLQVRSEFCRIDPFGKVIPVDSGSRPREILSPAVGRSAFTSYRLVVESDPEKPFTLHIAQNPEQTVRVALYREIYAKQGDGWIPDRLEPVALPFTGAVADPAHPIPGQTVQSFWLDLWVPAQTPPTRFRLEAQLNVGDQWIIYPLEVRVQQVVYPQPKEIKTGLTDWTLPSDSTALGVLREYLCGTVNGRPDSDISIRSMIRRNALQDVALAAGLEASRTKTIQQQSMIWAAGLQDMSPGEWCKSPKRPPASNAEWYLRVRDYLITGKLRTP